jgi:hypothetical protein
VVAFAPVNAESSGDNTISAQPRVLRCWGGGTKFIIDAFFLQYPKKNKKTNKNLSAGRGLSDRNALFLGD